MISRWPWLIPLRDMNAILVLLMGIHGIDPDTTINMIMALIATALVAITPTLGPCILGI